MTFCSGPLTSPWFAWPMSDHSDTTVSSLFWLPPAACWSWCVFQPWCVSAGAMLNRLQLCGTSLPFATPKTHGIAGKDTILQSLLHSETHTYCTSFPSVAVCLRKHTRCSPNAVLSRGGSFDCVFPALSHSHRYNYNYSSIFYVSWGLTRLLLKCGKSISPPLDVKEFIHNGAPVLRAYLEWIEGLRCVTRRKFIIGIYSKVSVGFNHWRNKQLVLWLVKTS